MMSTAPLQKDRMGELIVAERPPSHCFYYCSLSPAELFLSIAPGEA